MKRFVALFSGFMMGLIWLALSSGTAFAQDKASISVTLYCDRIDVSVTTRVSETATVTVNVVNEPGTADILYQQLGSSGIFTVSPGGTKSATFQYVAQPDNARLSYVVDVNANGTIARVSQSAACINFYKPTRLNESDGVQPLAVFCTSQGGVTSTRIDLKTGQTKESVTASPAQLAQALVNAISSGVNQQASSNSTGLSIWALTSSELQAVYRSTAGNYDFIFPVTLCGGIDISNVASTLGQTTPPTTTTTTQSTTQTILVPVNITTISPVVSGGACVTSAGFRYAHVVQAGQNLYRIGLFYGVPYTTIASVNGIANVNSIFAGQCLLIP